MLWKQPIITMSSFILMYNVFLLFILKYKKLHNNLCGKIIIIISIIIYIFTPFYNELLIFIMNYKYFFSFNNI
jgi:hypothetical protein